MFELGRAGIRRQDLEVRVGGIKIHGKADQLLDAFLGILQEADHIERCGGDAEFPAQVNHIAHVLVGNEPARDFLQDYGIGGLDTEGNLAQARRVHRAD